MRKPDRNQLQVAVICIGVVIAVFGFSIHFVVPGETRSGYPITVEASSYIVDEIRFIPGTGDYSFRLYLKLNLLYQNLSAYLLSETEYERFSTGTPIGEVDTIADFAGSPDYEWETSLSGDIDLRLVIFNNNTVRVFCGYYYVVIPATFFSSLTIGFAGLLVILAGLGWYLTGWRRYFILGHAVNLALFYVRVFTLVADVFAFSVLLEQTIEPYNDYLFFYLRWIPNLWEGAWPYTLDPASMMSGYVYPPLWVYTVGLLGSIPSWLPGLILLSFNVATGAVVFGISHRLTHDEKRSVFAMTLFLLNPITLVYGSFLWLNPTPYVFFVAFSFYLAVKGRKSGSIIAMAMATLYKQFAVVFFPLLVLALVKQDRSVDLRRGVVAFVKHSALYAALVGLVSVPFLLVDSEAFIGRMFIGSPGPESLATFHPELGWPVNFNTFFTWIGVPDVIAWAIAYLLAYYVLLGSFLILIYISFARFRLSEKIEARRGEEWTKKVITEALFWSILIVLTLQIFFPRGSYKFYLLALTPFISVLYDYRDLKLERTESFRFQRHYLMSMVVSWAVFLCFRLVYFWILLVWALFYLQKGNHVSNLSGYVRRIPRAKVSDTI